MNERISFASAAVAFSLLVPSLTARAERPVPDSPSTAIQQQLDAQEARIRELEAALARQSRQPSVQTASAALNGSILRRLDSIEMKLNQDQEAHEAPQYQDVSAQKWTSKWGGRIMGDYVMFAGQDAANAAAFGDIDNYYEFRRLRFFTEGEGYGVYDYKLQFDFEPENDGAEAVAIKDVYMGIHEIPFLGYVRFGNYKEPFSLEELTSSKYISFLERSLPNIFAPSRHVGATSYVVTPEEDATFSYGVFFEAIDQELKERIADNQGVDFAMRFTWLPIYANEGRHLVHVGGGWVFTDDQDDRVRFRARPEVHEGPSFVDTGAFDADVYYRFNKEVAVVWGPLSLQSEAFYVRTNGIAGTPDFDFFGAYAYASYFLTGENRKYDTGTGTFGRVSPFTNFWIVPTCQGTDVGWGAWEALIRWSYLDLDEPGLVITESGGIGQLHDLTVGMNWYWNPYMRVMLNWIHAFGDRLDVNNHDADIVSMRMQVDF